MTKYYSVNKEYAGGDGVGCIYDLVNTLVSASWTVQSASNGTSFDAGTTYWTPTSLAASNAWVTIKEPSGPGGREWCFQRTTNNYTWRVKVSPYIGFGAGSPSATQVPSATDEGIIWGAGTDASPTGYGLFLTSRFKFHVVAESTPVGPAGNQAYGFWSFHNIAGGMGTDYGFIGQEPMAVGSYPALTGSRAVTTSGEADPCIYGCNYNGNSGYVSGFYLHGYSEFLDGCTFKHFYKYQNASGLLTFTYDVGGTGGATYALFPRFVSVHPCSGEDTNLPFIVGRMGNGSSGYFNSVTSNVGLKGTCNFLKIRGTNRNTGVPVNLSTDAYIYIGDFLMPWPENIVPEL